MHATKTAPPWAATVRDLRLARGWRQVDLAEHADVTQSAIARIEAGQRNVSDDVKLRVSRALAVPWFVLFDLDGSFTHLVPTAVGYADHHAPPGLLAS